jgi:hypothetical protein
MQFALESEIAVVPMVLMYIPGNKSCLPISRLSALQEEKNKIDN